MADKIVRVCDECDAETPLMLVTIAYPGARWKAELCPDCHARFVAWLEDSPFERHRAQKRKVTPRKASWADELVARIER